MTDISEAAKAKAEQVLNDADMGTPMWLTLARFIQEVSDAAKALDGLRETMDSHSRIGMNESLRQEHIARWRGRISEVLAPFILPEPVDPLVDIIEALGLGKGNDIARDLRRDLAKRGLKIVEASA